MAGHALGVERQPVQNALVAPAALASATSSAFAAKMSLAFSPQGLRDCRQGLVLLLRGRQREHAGGGFRLGAERVHQPADIGCAFDGLERCGHD